MARKQQPENNDNAPAPPEGVTLNFSVTAPPIFATLPAPLQQQFVQEFQNLLEAAVANFLPSGEEDESEEGDDEDEGLLYVFKIWLRGARKIHRRIAMPEYATLNDLHEVLFHAFDRFDEHLYSFYLYEPGTSKKERNRPRIEYTDPVALQNLDGADDRANDVRDASATRLNQLGLTKGQVFEYLFDFGDSWEHEIEVEALDRVPDGGPYPRILEKLGESPAQYPEDDETE